MKLIISMIDFQRMILGLRPWVPVPVCVLQWPVQGVFPASHPVWPLCLSAHYWNICLFICWMVQHIFLAAVWSCLDSLWSASSLWLKMIHTESVRKMQWYVVATANKQRSENSRSDVLVTHQRSLKCYSMLCTCPVCPSLDISGFCMQHKTNMQQSAADKLGKLTLSLFFRELSLRSTLIRHMTKHMLNLLPLTELL